MKKNYFKMAVKNRHNFRAKKLPTPAHQNYAASLRFTSCSFFMFVFSLATIKPEDSKYIIAKDQMKSECILWQYGLWSFQTGGTKLERFLPKNKHTQRKLLNFLNWVSGEVSKIGHHFSK